MKKTALVATAIVCALLFAGCSGKKDATKYKANPASDFHYTLAGDGRSVVIQEYIGKKNPKMIVFPSEIEGLPVSSVCTLGKVKRKTIRYTLPVLGEMEDIVYDDKHPIEKVWKSLLFQRA